MTVLALTDLAANGTSAVVLAQLACSAPKLRRIEATDVLLALIKNPACENDSNMPLLIWWGLEQGMTEYESAIYTLLTPRSQQRPLLTFLAERWAMRLTASDKPDLVKSLYVELSFARGNDADLTPVIEGIAKGLEAGYRDTFPDEITRELRKLRNADPGNQRLLRNPRPRQ